MCFEFYCNPFYNIVNFKNKKLQIITASRKSYAYAPRYKVLEFNLQNRVLDCRRFWIGKSGPIAKVRSDGNN